MAEIKTEPVVAVVVNDVDEALDEPGAIEIRTEFPGAEGLAYVCPCGCKAQGWLPFRPQVSPSWAWDGNRERPTLEPSIWHKGHWHGWLKNGVWVSC